MICFLPLSPAFSLDSPLTVLCKFIRRNYLLLAGQVMLSFSLHVLFPLLLIHFTFFIWENPTGPLDSAEVSLSLGSLSPPAPNTHTSRVD